eukprot:s5128_g5.t1
MDTSGVNEEAMAPEGSPQGEESMPPDISPERDDSLHDQGIWGRVKNVVDPEAFKAAASAEAKNEKAFENMENANDKKDLEHPEEFKYFCEVILFWRREKKSHADARRAEGWRLHSSTYGLACRCGSNPRVKYTRSDGDLFGQLCRMDPVYSRRPSKGDVVFRSGDVRSTLDDQLMENAADVKKTALEVLEALQERVKELSESGNPATREELMNAMLHYFLAAGVDEEDIGDLSLDKIPSPQHHRFGLAEDGPVPVFTCKSKYAALIVNLGSFVRGRKQTAPSAFSQHLDYDYSRPSKGSLVKSLAQGKSHLFMACEASEINQKELEFLRDRGWSVIRNRSGDIMMGSRTNFAGESMKRLAGSTLSGKPMMLFLRPT